MNKSIIYSSQFRGRRGRDRMVVKFTTTCAISAYHHWYCEFESSSGRGVQHYVIQFVSDLWQVGGFLRFPLPIKLTATKVESDVEQHQANKKSIVLLSPFENPPLQNKKKFSNLLTLRFNFSWRVRHLYSSFSDIVWSLPGTLVVLITTLCDIPHRWCNG